MCLAFHDQWEGVWCKVRLETVFGICREDLCSYRHDLFAYCVAEVIDCGLPFARWNLGKGKAERLSARWVRKFGRVEFGWSPFLGNSAVLFFDDN